MSLALVVSTGTEQACSGAGDAGVHMRVDVFGRERAGPWGMEYPPHALSCPQEQLLSPLTAVLTMSSAAVRRQVVGWGSCVLFAVEELARKRSMVVNLQYPGYASQCCILTRLPAFLPIVDSLV